MSMRIDDFKAQLTGGGARANLFRVTGGFPGAASTGMDLAGSLGKAVAPGLTDTINSASNLVDSITGGSPAKQVPFLVRAAHIPASTMGMITVPYRGRQLKVPGDRTFSEWSITVLNDTTMNLRRLFEEWHNSMNDRTSNIGSTRGLYGIEQDWTVEQLNRDGTPIAKGAYKFHGCWPSEISTIDLDTNTTDAIEEYTVTMQYQYWEYLSGPTGTSLVKAVGALL